MNYDTQQDIEDHIRGLEKRFIESSEKDRIKEILIARLKSEGWANNMKELVKKEIRKQGHEKASVSSVYEELKTSGRKSVSDVAKTEVYELVKSWVQQETNILLSFIHDTARRGRRNL